MVFGYVSSLDRTVFRGICQVEPGTVMTFAQEGDSSLRYWRTPRSVYQGEGPQPEYDVAVSRLRQLMIESVELLATHGGHPLGIYLSGGLDSTILTLVAREILGHPVTTFTLADGSDSADLLAAREVAEKLGTQHVERRVTLDDCLGGLRHFVEHYESVVAGGVFDVYGGLAFHLLSETVSQHVRVAFSGEGADELFGGYYWVYTHPLGFADRIRSRLNSFGSRDQVARLVDGLFPYPEDERLYRRNAFNALMQGGLANYHLQSVDRSAGAFGFEIRPAYLFDDLAEYVLGLPIEYKVPDKRTTKRILRDAFRPELERLGLDWVLTRPKEGMPAALHTLAPAITRIMEDAVEDSTFSEHPLRPFFVTKADQYLFNVFAEAFLPQTKHALYSCVSQ